MAPKRRMLEACRGTGIAAMRASLVTMTLLAGTCLAERLSEDDIRWREKVGWNERVHGTSGGGGRQRQQMQKLLARLPYAFYPYTNELEVIFDTTAALKQLPEGARRPAEAPKELTVRVLPVDGEKAIFSGTVKLDAKGRGHGLFRLPKLPKGEFRVEYGLGGAVLKAPRTFQRTYFEFEHNDIGKQHKVYAPFTPVQVKGGTVSVVQRTYTLNGLGLFSSVVSKGRELLAAPMTLVVELADGRKVKWADESVSGKALYPDLAVFQTRANGDGLAVASKVSVEEDGCAKVEMTLQPADAKTPAKIKRAYLEMAVKESEAPLCHLVGMNSMRHNYAGKVPRGGKIKWIQQSWRPARFEVEPFQGKTPGSYEVWGAHKQMHWGSQRWNFAPYVWLGAEERGLAWFGDHTGGYETDGKRAIQRLFIEPGKVVLRVELIQRPVTLERPRHFEFGLQASPTKPMPKNWRSYSVPGGGGMQVNVWGGYNCAWHYPDPKDWRIVEKIIEARGANTNPNWDPKAVEALFKEMNAKREFSDLKVHGRKEWLADVLSWAGRQAGQGRPNGVTVYYEEFQTSGHHPESYEFMDEWDLGSFCRYTKFDYHHKNRGKKAWGPQARTANQESWRDFAVYYANEWMKRGVGIYYDNTYPQVDRNRFNLREHGVPWQSSIWGHRDYFRRVWKRSRELMAKGQTPLDPLHQKTEPGRRMRLHIIGHVTNTQVLPYTTWWDATLGVESPGPWVPDHGPTPEQAKQSLDRWGFLIMPTPKKGRAGKALPYSPDYLRAMEMGRMAGLIPHYRHLLRGEDAFGGIGLACGSTDKPAEEVLAHRHLADKAMGMVHEIRGGTSSWKHPGIRALSQAFANYGYGRAGVTVHNYWAAKPFLQVDNPKIKWIALAREDRPSLVLLQSYDGKPCQARINLAKGCGVLDLLTRRPVDPAKPIQFAADYGPRLLYIARDVRTLQGLAWADGVALQADFGFGLPPGWKSRGKHAPRIVRDPRRPGNKVLRITPAHPSQHWVQGQAEGDYELSFRFRLPKAVGKLPHKQFFGFLQLLHRWAREWPKQTGYTLALGMTPGPDGAPVLAAGYRASREGKQATFESIQANRLKEAGRLSPLDTKWHGVSIRVEGSRHQVSMDGTLLFDGKLDVSKGGKLRLGPGWGSWSTGLPHVDIDDIVVKRIGRK